MRRGEVWLAEFAPPRGPRPVVLVSRDEAYAVRNLVMVAPVTRRVRGIPAEVPLGPGDGLPKPSVANLDSIETVPKASLRRRLALLTPAKVAAVDDALRFALGLDEGT
jgi:mRNA interferase MazF